MITGVSSAILVALAFASSTGESSIHEAARCGDLARIRALLGAEPALLEARDGSERTPLHHAVRHGRIEVARLLVGSGADLYAQEYGGRAALHLVRDPDLARLLLQAGADLHFRGSLQLTPLQEAIERNRPEVVDAFLEAGEELDFVSALVLGRAERVEAMIGVRPHLADSNVSGHVYDCIGEGLRCPLHIAADLGHIDVVRVLLDHGAEVNRRFRPLRLEFTALNLAVWGDHLEMAELLLERGAEPDLPGAVKYFGSLLDYAATGRSPALVQLLLSHGARLTVEGLPTLHLAAREGRLEVVRLLLEHGADPGLVWESSGATAIFYAALQGHAEVVDLLLDSGGALDIFGAAALGRSELVTRLLAESFEPIDATDEALGWNALAFAVWNERLETARLLIEEGTDVDQELPPCMDLYDSDLGFRASRFPRKYERAPSDPDVSPSRPLGLAVRRRNAELARLLLECGARSDGATLHEAIRADEAALELTRLLLEFGTDPDAVGRGEKTALHEARLSGEPVPMLELLLSHGAYLDARGPRGWSVLELAILEGQEDVVQALLEHEPKISFVAACGLGLTDRVRERIGEEPELVHLPIELYAVESPAVLAARDGQLDVLRLLVLAGAECEGANPNGPLAVAARHGQTEVVEYLLSLGSDVRVRTGYRGQGLLHEAARSDEPALIGRLLELGLGVNTRDEDGRSPLHEAAQHGSCRAIEFLLDTGAEIEARSEAGYTPLHWAVLLPSEDPRPVIELLVERGAEIDALDQRGRTPLQGAIETLRDFEWSGLAELVRGAVEAVAVLREFGAEE